MRRKFRISEFRMLSRAGRNLLPILALCGPAAGANAQEKAGSATVNTRQALDNSKRDTPDTTASGAVAKGIDPVAIWDGRKRMPFKALDYPKMVSAEQGSFLSADEYVLGMTINGESRAYPTRYMWWHHFINDKTDKAGPENPDFMISYCSVCNTGIRFDPRVNGKTLLFDFYGLYNGVVIMCDRDTQSVWLQVEGRAVKGPRMGAQMQSRPLLDTTWGAWKKLHPDTLVMTGDTPYKQHYGDKVEPRGYDKFPMPVFEQTLTRHDARLPAFDKVLGVTITTYAGVPIGPDGGPPDDRVAGKALSSVHRAYPLATLQQAGGVVNDKLDGLSIVVLLDADTQTACALLPWMDDKSLAATRTDAQGKSTQHNLLTFEARKDASGKTAFYDKETGTRWSVEGVGLEGPLAKKSLTRVDNHLSQWYGWAAYFPDTDIYGRTDAPQPEKSANPAPAKP